MYKLYCTLIGVVVQVMMFDVYMIAMILLALVEFYFNGGLIFHVYLRRRQWLRDCGIGLLVGHLVKDVSSP